jgi:hypothetical protein
MIDHDDIPAELWADMEKLCDTYVGTNKPLTITDIYEVLRKYWAKGSMHWRLEEALMEDDGLFEQWLCNRYDTCKGIVVDYTLLSAISSFYSRTISTMRARNTTQ